MTEYIWSTVLDLVLLILKLLQMCNQLTKGLQRSCGTLILNYTFLSDVGNVRFRFREGLVLSRVHAV